MNVFPNIGTPLAQIYQEPTEASIEHFSSHNNHSNAPTNNVKIIPQLDLPILP